VNSTDLQNAFGKYLSLVDKEDIIVTKNGKSLAKITGFFGRIILFMRRLIAIDQLPKGNLPESTIIPPMEAQ